MQDADDIVRLPTPERHAGVGRSDDLAHELVGRQVGVDEPHFGAMNHHIRHRDLGQLQKAAEHIALVSLDFPFAVKNVDRSHQLLMAGNSRIQIDKRDAAQTQDAAHQRLDCADDRSENGHEEQHERRDQQRNAVRIGDRDRLRHHLAKNDNQRGHDYGRGPHPVIAVENKKYAGGDRR